MKNKIGCFIAWYIIKYHKGRLDIKRKAGSNQTIRVMSTQCNENIVQKAIDCLGEFITKKEMASIIVDKNNEIEKLKLELAECQDKTILAIRNCNLYLCQDCELQGRCNTLVD